MKRRIADRHPDLIRIGRHHLLHKRIELAASLARGIEKLDDVYRCIGVADTRSIEADQGSLVLLGGLLRLLRLLVLEENGAGNENQHQQHCGSDK
jgi:hypothetical protein